MKRWLALACACWMMLVGTALAPNALAQETEAPDPEAPNPQAMKAALRYFEAMRYDQIMQDTLELMATQVPEEVREDFKAHFGAYMRDKYKPAMAELMVRHFTLEELEAMAEFYESDVGRSIAEKMIPFTMDTMPFNEQQVMRMVLSFMEAHPELMDE